MGYACTIPHQLMEWKRRWFLVAARLQGAIRCKVFPVVDSAVGTVFEAVPCPKDDGTIHCGVFHRCAFIVIEVWMMVLLTYRHGFSFITAV